ncbi:DctP family TRAP transporter solute-binding subunit [Nesterenkonia sp. NBAIMH1]|uniref:DctP family TRAP transporter solute-binding subunit n=1 Tax=Nesterenkonia sp. NBAIMH1 TaxID=2600320 RepID=UPI0011B6233E|nr:DctP family TRAP transporter solute-binding subunit [Nesterenkonia sp. NBAIMH1]
MRPSQHPHSSTRTTRPKRTLAGAAAVIPLLALSACGDDADSDSEAVTLTLAHSYNEGQPMVDCGVATIEDEVNGADAGITIDTYGSSSLGGDSDRIADVASGDIDIDIQGASALGAVYEPISVFDAAYAFDDAEHLRAFMDSSASEDVIADFRDTTGIHTLGAWSAGSRHFTANDPIREPDDLSGLQIRFPGSPQYLMNAQALGANATEVAFEEIYLSLQQGAVDGQENPTNIIAADNIDEVQDYVSLTAHQQNTNLVIIGEVWDELNDEQQQVLTDSVEMAVDQVAECIADQEEEILDEWRSEGSPEVVEDVDLDAFREQAFDYFEENFDDESLTVFESIRGEAE